MIPASNILSLVLRDNMQLSKARVQLQSVKALGWHQSSQTHCQLFLLERRGGARELEGLSHTGSSPTQQLKGSRDHSNKFHLSNSTQPTLQLCPGQFSATETALLFPCSVSILRLCGCSSYLFASPKKTKQCQPRQDLVPVLSLWPNETQVRCFTGK